MDTIIYRSIFASQTSTCQRVGARVRQKNIGHAIVPRKKRRKKKKKEEKKKASRSFNLTLLVTKLKWLAVATVTEYDLDVLVDSDCNRLPDVPRCSKRLPEVTRCSHSPRKSDRLHNCRRCRSCRRDFLHTPHSIKLPCRCLAVKVLTYTTQHEERPCSRVRQVVFSPRKSDMTTKVCHDSAWAINSDKLRKVQRTCPTNPPSIQSFRSHRILLLFQTSSCTDSIGK